MCPEYRVTYVSGRTSARGEFRRAMARCLAEARRPKADYRANQLRQSSPTKEFRLTTVERHRTEGFLPVDDFLAHLKLGLAKTSLQRGAFDEAERRFREVVAEHPQSEPAPEALYWVGVSRYKGKNDARALAETAQVFTTRYAESPWAKKASVWRAA
jgi:TolA-binding protein